MQMTTLLSPLVRLTILLLLQTAFAVSQRPPLGIDVTPFQRTFLSNKSSAAWHELIATPDEPSSFHPAARYGHAGVATGDALIISHGYYYNHTAKAAVWLSDTWTFYVYEREWALLHPQCEDDSACPSARFGATAVQHEMSLFLYGGDDGGHRRGEHSYTYSLLADLWRLSLRIRQPHWVLLSTKITSTALTAAGFVASAILASSQSLPHAQHTTCIVHDEESASKQLLVFGGMVPRGAGDTEDSAGSDLVSATNQLWAVELGIRSDSQWRHLQCMNPPPARFGHAMSTAIQSSFDIGSVHTVYMHGGSRRGHGNFGDLWQLQLFSSTTRCSWTLLSTVTDKTHPSYSPHGPFSRGYASLAATSTFLLLFGGSYCSPGCVCSHETWAWDLRDHEWSSPRLITGNVPQGRYKHSGVVSRVEEGGGVVELLVYGGESYHPQKYHSDVWLLLYDHSHGNQYLHWWTAAPVPSTLHLCVFGLTPLIAIVLVINHKRKLRREMKVT